MPPTTLSPVLRRLWWQAQRWVRRDTAARWQPWALALGAGVWAVGLVAVLGLGLGSWLVWWWLSLWTGMAVALVAMCVVWAWPVAPQRVLRELEERGRLGDALRSAWELPPDDYWQPRIVAQAEGRAMAVDWTTAWPKAPAPGQRAAALGWLAVALAWAGLALWQRADGPATTEATLTDAQRRALLQQWPTLLEPVAEPERWGQVEQQAAAVREALASDEASAREILAEVAKLEDALAELRDALAAEGALAKEAPQLAEVLQQLQEGQAAAQPVSERRWQEASDAVERGGDEMVADPNGQDWVEDAESTAESAEDMADRLSEAGQQQASDALRQMAEGMRRQQRQQTGEGMRELAEAMRQQAAREQAQQNLQPLAEALAEARAMAQQAGQSPGEGTAEGSLPGSEGEPTPQPGLLAGQQPGAPPEASTASATRPTADQLMALAGLKQAGESQRRTRAATTGGAEAARAEGATPSDLSAYEALSQQAVTDESIPPAHRRAIRRYFDLVRPPVAAEPAPTTPPNP